MIDANQGEHSTGGQVIKRNEYDAKPAPPKPAAAGPGQQMVKSLTGMAPAGVQQMANKMMGGAPPSADPTSPNFSYDIMCKDFFGGNFFSQIMMRNYPEDIIDAM